MFFLLLQFQEDLTVSVLIRMSQFTNEWEFGQISIFLQNLLVLQKNPRQVWRRLGNLEKNSYVQRNWFVIWKCENIPCFCKNELYPVCSSYENFGPAWVCSNGTFWHKCCSSCMEMRRWKLNVRNRAIYRCLSTFIHCYQVYTFKHISALNLKYMNKHKT